MTVTNNWEVEERPNIALEPTALKSEAGRAAAQRARYAGKTRKRWTDERQN